MGRQRSLPQNHRQFYTEEDGEQIRELFTAGYALPHVARKLKRSIYGIRWFLQREKTCMTDLRQQDGAPVYTATQLAEVMGTYAPKVIMWVRAGYLEATTPPKRTSRQQILISSEQFLAFLARRDTWMMYDVYMIADDDYRQYALSLRAAVCGEWLKIRYIADRLGYSASHAMRRARQGHYQTAIRRTCPDGGGYHWFIWSAEVEAIERGREYHV